jgi:hypothetical protein
MLLIGEASWGGPWGHGQDTQSVNLMFSIVRGRGASEISCHALSMLLLLGLTMLMPCSFCHGMVRAGQGHAKSMTRAWPEHTSPPAHFTPTKPPQLISPHLTPPHPTPPSLQPPPTHQILPPHTPTPTRFAPLLLLPPTYYNGPPHGPPHTTHTLYSLPTWDGRGYRC